MELHITKKLYLGLHIVKVQRVEWHYAGWKQLATEAYHGWHFECSLWRFLVYIDLDKYHTLFGSYSYTQLEYRSKLFGLYHKGFNDATEYLGAAAAESLLEALYGMNPEKEKQIVKFFKQRLNTRIMNL